MRLCRSQGLLLLLLLLLAAGAGAHGQQAAKQKAADRRFLLSRGIGLDPAAGPMIAPAAALEAARRQAAGAVAARPAAIRPEVRGLAKQSANANGIGAGTSAWQPLGPLQVNTPAYGSVTGRISSIAVDSSDPSGGTVYVGATGGGVWKSGINGNAAFQPLTDDLPAFQSSPYLPSLSIGALSLDPGNNQVVLAGTGDPNDALDSYYGAGILRSDNGGSTWSQISTSSDQNYQYSFKGAGIAGFAWSTATANLVVMAVSQSLEGQIVGLASSSQGMPEAGLYYSTDAGGHWYLATITDGTDRVIQSSGSVSQTAQPPGNPATAVVWNRQRGMFFAAVRFHGYYSSPDGVTWTRLQNQPGAGLTVQNCPANPNGVGSTGCPIFRGVLAVQPVTGDTFALTTDLNNLDQGLYRDVCSTSGLAVNQCNTSATLAWGTKLNDTALEDGNGQIAGADYNLALTAVPSQQDTLLFAGTEDVFRCSLANSCTWRNTTNTNTCNSGQVAPSVHAIDGTLGAGGLVYFGTDGGLWRTTDGLSQAGPVCSANDAAHFQNLNGGLGSLAEVSHLAVTPNNGSLVLAGLGALGVASSASGTGVWQQLLTGEGSYVAIDPNTPGSWYADAFAGVGIYGCPNGANCTTAGFGASPGIARAQVEDDTDYFLDPAPWILDPGNPANILLGTCRMWLGPASGGWTGSNLLSVPLDGAGGSFCNGNGVLRSVGAGGSYNSGGEQIYAGMAGPVDGGASVPGHIYGATVPQSGGVQSWKDLWRNPVTNQNMSQQFNPTGGAISSIAIDPSDTSGKTVYVGIAGFPQGQGGVLYRSTDGGSTWANLTNSLPFLPVNKVVVDPNNPNYVYVAGDFGVYWTGNVGNCVPRFTGHQNCWTQLASGLPNAPVTDLAVVNNGGVNALEASTYGRGIWTLGLTTSSVPAQATLSPGSATFQAAGVGSPSTTTANFTLANTGSVPLNISQIAVSPSDYADSNNCGASLAPGASCSISVTFTPTAVGDRQGALRVTGNTQPGTTTASLDGTGLTPGHLTASPGTVTFPTTATGTNSAPVNVSITDDGGAPVQLQGRTIGGANPSEFALGTGSTCGSSLSAGATCTVPVLFEPSNTGTRTAVLTISGSSNSQTVNLNGNAIRPAFLTWTPSQLQFADTGTGNFSNPQTITVTNTGQAAAQLGAAAVSSGDYTLGPDGCSNLALSGNANCTVTVRFTPRQTGTRADLFTLPTTSVPPGDVPKVSMSGTGLPPPVVTLSPNPLAFDPQQQGTTSAVRNITVTNSGGSEAQFTPASITGNSDFTIASNTCGTALGPSANCTIGITFTPAQPNSRPNGTLTVPYGSNGPQTATLTGTGTAPAMLALSPNPVSFPTTADNATSGAQSLLVRNTGGNAATLNSPAVTGPFGTASTDCPTPPQTLAAGGSCTVNLTFSPPGTAAYSGQITLTGSFANSPVSAALQGQGATPPGATINPASATFPSTPQGAPSAAQAFTVTSTGGVPVTLGAPTLSTTDYYLTGSGCPQTLNPGASCQVQVVFHPSAPGPKPATLQFATNAPGGTLTANLSGTGTPPGVLTISPGALQFGTRVIGTTSATQTATVSDTGGTAVALGNVNTSGDYSIQSTTCGATLSAGSSCVVNVSFSPTAAGDRSGQLTVPGDGSEASAVTTLDGNGVAPGSLSFSPASLAFGPVATDASASLTITVTNGGGTAVHFSATGASGDFSAAGGSCAANGALAAGGTCTVQINFAPSAQGSRTGSLTIANDGSPASVAAALAGTGVAPGNLTSSPAGVNFGDVAVNTSAPVQTIRFSNGGGAAVALGNPVLTGSAFTFSNGCGATLAVGANCAVQVGFRPTQHGLSAGNLSLAWQDTGSGSGTAQAALSGTGVNPGALAFTPSPVQFGPVVIGASAVQTVAISNTGDLAVSLGVPFTSNGYTVVSGCPSSLTAGASCSVQIGFTPSTAGSAPGLLTVSASDGSGTWTDALAGTGVLPGSIAASPGNLGFPSTVIGGSSSPQTVTFSNPGGVSVPLSAPQVSSAEYAIVQSSCGPSLNPSGSCTASVVFTPSARGDQAAMLTLAGSNSGGPVARVTLDGTGLAPAQLAFAPASLDFGSQAERTRTRAPQTLTLTNTGDTQTTLGLPVLAGQYVIANDSCVDSATGLGVTLGGGAACTLGVEFQPTSQGAQAGSVAIADVSGVPSANAGLNGTGLALVLDGSIPDFPYLAVGASQLSPNLITVENLGETTITFQQFNIAGDFSINKSSCGGSLPPQTSCSFYVLFSPTTDGIRSGSFIVSDGEESSSLSFSGKGFYPPTDTLSATALSFPATQQNSTSVAQQISITNSGDFALLGLSTRSQTDSQFSVVNNCGSSLAGRGVPPGPMQVCYLSINFKPTIVGSVNETLMVVDQMRMQLITLTGEGIRGPLSAQATPPSPSPSVLDFGYYANQVATKPQVVTIYNNNRVQLTSLTLSLDDPEYVAGSSTCGNSLDSGASCQVSIVFTPSSVGAHPGALHISGIVDAFLESNSVTLSGSGEDFGLTVTNANANANNQQANMVVVTQGQTANFTITLTPLGDPAAYTSPSVVAITCSGAPANSTCGVPAMVTVPPGGAPGSGALTITTVGSTTASANQISRWWTGGAALALLCPFLLTRSEARRRLLVAAAAILLIGSPIACGVHATGVQGNSSGAQAGQTPTGTYTITVQASFPGAVRTATVQLVVQ